MSLVAELLLVWLVGIPAAVTTYAAVSRRWYERRIARRLEVTLRPATVVRIDDVRRLRTRSARHAGRRARLSA